MWENPHITNGNVKRAAFLENNWKALRVCVSYDLGIPLKCLYCSSTPPLYNLNTHSSHVQGKSEVPGR